ncbi:MAG: MFS transporter [Candidatus Nanopelagicales bacterium]
MGLFGWFLYTLGPSLSLLRDETGLSRTASILYTLAASIGGIVAGLLVAVIVGRLGRGWLLRAGSISLALGIGLFISGAPMGVTVLGPFFASAAGAGCVVGVSAFLTAQQRSAADASITESNTVAAAFGIMSPLLLGAAAAWLGGWRLSLWLLVISVLALEIVRGRSVQAYNIGAPRSSANTPRHRMPALTWWAIGVLVLTSAVEMCFLFWSADLLGDRGGLGAAASAAALSAVLVGVLVGRGLGSWMVERWDTERVLLGAMGFLFVGFAITWITPSATVMLVGLFVVGLGISVQFPLGMSRLMRASAGAADKAGGIASSGIGVAGATVPALLAFLADAFSVHLAFLIVPVVLAIALVMLRLRPVPADLPEDQVTG